MVFVQTRLKIVDNSGGFEAMCIGILGKSYRKGLIGDVLVFSIKKIIINRKIKHQKKKKILKGSVWKGILIRMSSPQKRWGNYWIRGFSNSVAILGNWDLPFSNRIKGPLFFEIKNTKFSKFSKIGEGIV